MANVVLVIDMTRAFWDTSLAGRLLELKPDKVIVTGVCTDVCVCRTTGDARDRDYEVEIPVDCVASFDGKAHYFALEHMEKVLGERLKSVRLDTPSERGGVTIDLVKEVRVRLDLAGFKNVGILVSGGINLERISHFLDSGAPVDGFGVGSYISGARPIDFAADLHQIDGKPIAKRGRIPGITANPRLKKESM